MQEKRDIIAVHSQLPFEYCSSVLREALRQSQLEIVSELAVHHEVQRKLGLPVSKYTVFTVWDPLLTYQALTAEAESPYCVPFNIIVCEEGPWSTVLVPKPADTGFGTEQVGTTLMARTAEKEIMKILASVTGKRTQRQNRAESSGIPGRLQRRLQGVLRFVTGGAR